MIDTSASGFDRYELSQILPLMEAVNKYNPTSESPESIVAEVTLWRGGKEIAVITTEEGGGLRLIAKAVDAL